MCQNCNSIHRVVDCKMSVSVLLKIVKWLSRMKIFLISKRSLKQCICCPEFGKVHFVPNGLYRPCTWGNAFWLHGVTRSNTFRLHLSPEAIHLDCIWHQSQYILTAFVTRGNTFWLHSVTRDNTFWLHGVTRGNTFWLHLSPVNTFWLHSVTRGNTFWLYAVTRRSRRAISTTRRGWGKAGSTRRWSISRRWWCTPTPVSSRNTLAGSSTTNWSSPPRNSCDRSASVLHSQNRRPASVLFFCVLIGRFRLLFFSSQKRPASAFLFCVLIGRFCLPFFSSQRKKNH